MRYYFAITNLINNELLAYFDEIRDTDIINILELHNLKPEDLEFLEIEIRAVPIKD